jgi:hypothetical protein
VEPSTVLNELASHIYGGVTPSVPKHVLLVTTLTAMSRLVKPELKVAC